MSPFFIFLPYQYSIFIRYNHAHGEKAGIHGHANASTPDYHMAQVLPTLEPCFSGGACVEHQTSPGPSKRQTSPSPEATDEKMEPSMLAASPISIFTPGDHPTIWPLSTASFSPSASLQQ